MINKKIYLFLVAVFLILTGCSDINTETSSNKKGLKYKELTTGLSSDYDVIEFFSYTCPHCAALEPKLENWITKSDKNVKRIHVVFSAQEVKSSALLYNALVLTGEWNERIHRELFDLISTRKINIKNEDFIIDFLNKNKLTKTAKLLKDSDFLKNESNSTENIQVKELSNVVKENYNLQLKAKIDAVPRIVFNNKYSIDAQSAGGVDEIFTELDSIFKFKK